MRFREGDRLGRYVITGFVAHGVSGDIYRATHSDLGLEFAIKVLHMDLIQDGADSAVTEHARERLREEARALCLVHHDHVTRFYEFQVENDGLAYIVMDYVNGETLEQRLERGPLAEERVIEIGVQLASGLAESHRKEVLHRDLKPSNVMLSETGEAKLIDFGLAKTDRPRNIRITDEHNVPGTLAYLAPEILAGGEHHKGSDVYALGLVLREAATGTPLARDGRGNAGLEPVPALSPRLNALIARCLEPDPGARLGSARELADGLRRLQAKPDHLKRWTLVAMTVAAVGLAWPHVVELVRQISRPPVQTWDVLPFEVAAADSMHAYIAEGIASSLAGRLSELKSIHVIAWESSRRYPTSRATLPRIAHELGTQGVVTGHMTFNGHARVDVHFSNGLDNQELGSYQLNRGLDEIPDLQKKLERQVASRVIKYAKTGEKLPKAEEDYAGSTANDDYHHARSLWDRRPDSLFRAIDYFERAIREDSVYAPAHAGLSDAWAAVGLYGLRPPLDVRRMARNAARRAVSLDAQLSDAHSSRAHILHNYDWDWEGALSEYRDAIELNPNNATAHHGLAHVLATLGRHEEALAEIRQAAALNPRSLPTLIAIGAIKYYARDYAGALDTLRAVARIDPNNVLRHRLMAAVLDRLGRTNEAVEELAKAAEASGQPALAKGLRGAFAARGLDGALEVMIGALIQKRAMGAYEPAEHVAELYARLGKVEKAFEWLEIAFREHDTELNRLKVDPLFDPLRRDPRFEDLMKRVGFMDLPS